MCAKKKWLSDFLAIRRLQALSASLAPSWRRGELRSISEDARAISQKLDALRGKASSSSG